MVTLQIGRLFFFLTLFAFLENCTIRSEQDQCYYEKDRADYHNSCLQVPLMIAFLEQPLSNTGRAVSLIWFDGILVQCATDINQDKLCRSKSKTIPTIGF